MKRQYINAVSLALICTALASHGEGYGGGRVGAGAATISELGQDIELDAGASLGLVAGYNLTENFAIEAEGIYQYNPGTLYGSDLELGQLFGFANARASLPVDVVTPFVYAGFGIVNGCLTIDDHDYGSETTWAYQLGAGIAVELAQGISAEIGARYLETGEYVEEYDTTVSSIQGFASLIAAF
jgi:opacity protein-like surface antigen